MQRENNRKNEGHKQDAKFDFSIEIHMKKNRVLGTLSLIYL
jgi:hypothetical protein